ncbi:hypothetical protein PENSPDRAFT_751293, partial [Peniophora sp. CONT]
MSIAGELTLLHQLTALQNLTLIFGGIYLHEFTVHLQFDWRLMKRQSASSSLARAARWIYVMSRIFMLVYSICVAVMAFPGPRHCHPLMKLFTVSGWIGTMSSSMLLSIRVGAVWQWDKCILSILGLVWLGTWATAIYSMVKVDSSYENIIHSCAFSGVHGDLLPTVALVISDCTVLTLLLFGLQRKWSGARQHRTGHLLWTQGLLYLVIATLSEVPLLILLVLDINSIMNTILVTPAAIILTISASRLYRSLHASVRGEDTYAEHFTKGTLHGTSLAPKGIELKMLRKVQGTAKIEGSAVT